MREDAWHEEAHGDSWRDDEDDLLRTRSAARDPRRNDWSLVDLGVGWLAGAAAMGAVSLLRGIVTGLLEGEPTWWGGAPFVLLFGLPVLTAYGLPIAAVAATILRPVRAEWVHLATFALLGAVGCILFSAVMTEGGIGLLAASLPYGVTTAVVARLVAKRAAISRAGARSRVEEDDTLPTV